MVEKINKKERITEIVRLLSYGYKIKDIAKILKVSESTIYRDYQEYRTNSDSVISDILYKIDKINIQKSLNDLSYSDVCILSKKLKCGDWIRKKEKKIEKLTPFISMFFYFDLNPTNYNKNDIKRAYFKKAKQIHPDITKINTNKEFSDMNVIYNTLLKTIAVM